MEFKDIKAFINKNTEEVSAILDSSRLAIINAAEIKILHSKFLIEFWKARPNKNIIFVIYFSETHIQNLDFETIKDNLNNPITERLKTHNYIGVDHRFNIQTSEQKGLSQEEIEALSKKDTVVFCFGEEGIDIAAKGKIINKINFFYNEEDRMKFAKLFHISQLQDCLDKYKVFIKQPGINEAFFASAATVKKIEAVNPSNNILVNKPENVLRNNLLTFLNSNTQHTFSKENELNSKRELDLYTEVEGKKFMIEVKWLGQSINDDDTGFTQRVTDVSARDGVTQTLEYIQELIENMNYNLHCGYLCVFDARETKKPVNYRSFDFINADLLPYYNNHFIKLNEIALDRNA